MESRSFANGNGDSETAPDTGIAPLWLKGNWEYAMARNAQFSTAVVHA